MQPNTNYPLRVPFLSPPLPPCTLPPSVFAVASLTSLRVLQWGHQTLVNSLCSAWNLQLQRRSRLLNTHTCAAVKTSKAIELGLSVKPDPVITIWSSTSDLSAGQCWSLLPAPAPGSRVTYPRPRPRPRPCRGPSVAQRPCGGAETLRVTAPTGTMNINALDCCGTDHHISFQQESTTLKELMCAECLE